MSESEYPYQVMGSLTDEEYSALKNDIKENGVEVAVVVDEKGTIIDGHHRVQACGELGIGDYPTDIRSDLTDREKRKLAWKLNSQRRQIDTETKKENIEEYLQTTWDGDETDKEIGKTLGASRQWVSETKQELLTDGGIEIHGKNATTCIFSTQKTRALVWEYVTDNPDASNRSVADSVACKVTHSTVGNITNTCEPLFEQFDTGGDIERAKAISDIRDYFGWDQGDFAEHVDESESRVSDLREYTKPGWGDTFIKEDDEGNSFITEYGRTVVGALGRKSIQRARIDTESHSAAENALDVMMELELSEGDVSSANDLLDGDVSFIEALREQVEDEPTEIEERAASAKNANKSPSVESSTSTSSTSGSDDDASGSDSDSLSVEVSETGDTEQQKETDESTDTVTANPLEHTPTGLDDEMVAEIKENVQQLESDMEELEEHPDTQHLQELVQNWVSFNHAIGYVDDLLCPECGSDHSHLKWDCCDISFEEATVRSNEVIEEFRDAMDSSDERRAEVQNSEADISGTEHW